jgi:hypothetical protein
MSSSAKIRRDGISFLRETYAGEGKIGNSKEELGHQIDIFNRALFRMAQSQTL